LKSQDFTTLRLRSACVPSILFLLKHLRRHLAGLRVHVDFHPGANTWGPLYWQPTGKVRGYLLFGALLTMATSLFAASASTASRSIPLTETRLAANNCGVREPGTNEEIKTFCTRKYSVTFPMNAKISVKGPD
jgi:hypothetical protein